MRDKMFSIVFILCSVLSIGLLCAATYVVVHFIEKYW